MSAPPLPSSSSRRPVVVLVVLKALAAVAPWGSLAGLVLLALAATDLVAYGRFVRSLLFL